MKKPLQEKKRNDIILSIYPNHKGFGYAIINNVREPIDYGIVNIRNSGMKIYLKKAQEIIELYHPTVLILEDYSCSSYRKTQKVQKIIATLNHHARSKELPVYQYSKKQIREAFSAFQAKSKFEIAKVINSWIPELERIPIYKRKAWESEAYTMTVFDSFALALTHFYLN